MGRNNRVTTKRIDQMDLRILGELQADGRLSIAELSRRVNLSPTPCLERVRRLERDGFISGYRAVLNPAKLGLPLVVFIEVALDRTSPDLFDRFRDAVRLLPEVEECHMIAGGFDYLIKVRLPAMERYRTFLGEFNEALPGIKTTHTYVVMEEVSARGEIPLAESRAAQE